MIATTISAAIAPSTIHRRLREREVIGSAVMWIIVWLLLMDLRHAMEGNEDRKRQASSYRFRTMEERDQIPESGSGYADSSTSRRLSCSRVPHEELPRSGPALDRAAEAQDFSLSFREQTWCRNTSGWRGARPALPSENGDR